MTGTKYPKCLDSYMLSIKISLSYSGGLRIPSLSINYELAEEESFRIIATTFIIFCIDVASLSQD